MLRVAVRSLLAALACVPVAALAGGGCASGGGTGIPVADPGALAAEVRAATGAEDPYRIRFRWQYGDEKGRLSGDGVARINPPDRFRLDLFTPGEGSMAVALADDSLSTLGEIEDLRLPSAPFLYAMAGLLRPGSELPAEGYRTDGDAILVYEMPDGARRSFFLEGKRLARVEERSGSRVTQRIRLEWDAEGRWPSQAEYRDLVTPRRVRWTLEEARREPKRFPLEIYDLATPR